MSEPTFSTVATVDPAFDRVLARVTELEAENAALLEALSDLVSWFPDDVPPPEYRIRAGEYGATDAVIFARAAIEKARTV